MPPAVEAEVASHPGVAIAAAVAMPDPVFGERVCLYVQVRPGHQITLDDIVAPWTPAGSAVNGSPSTS